MNYSRPVLIIMIFISLLSANDVMTFDGNGDYIEIRGDAPKLHDNFSEQTISLWFKPATDPANSGRQMLFELGGFTAGVNIYLVGNTLYGGIWSGGYFIKN